MFTNIKLNKGGEYSVEFSVEDPLIELDDVLGLMSAGYLFFEHKIMITCQNLFYNKLLNRDFVDQSLVA